MSFVWGLDGDGNSDTIMEHIRKIRAKFAVHTLHNYIETFGGVVIGGTPKKYGTKEIFPAIIPLLFGSGISPAWGSYLPMSRH